MRNLIIVAGMALAGSGCASTSVSIDPIHVPDATYAALDCEALNLELRLAHLRVESLANSQDAVARRDYQAMLWTGPFGVQGDRASYAGGLAMAKGQRDALIRVSTAKRCGERSAESGG